MSEITWCFIICCFVVGTEGDPHYATEGRLKAALLSDYDKTVPPLVALSDNVTVTFSIALLAIDSLNAETGVLTTHVWLRMFWKDVRLSWGKEQYNGQEKISIPAAAIWKPDMVPYNNADSLFSPSADYHVVVSNSGDVAYIPHVLLVTSCAVDLTRFPFDQQTCIIKFGSWTYSGATVSLIGEDDVDLSIYKINKMWTLLNVSSKVSSKKYDCCAEEYHDYQAKLVLQRRSAGVMNMYTGPAVCMGLLVPSVFLLPAGSSHKLVLGTGLLISHMLLLDMLVEVLPISDFTVPRLALYYLANIVLISLSIAFSVVTICLWEKAKRGGDGVPVGINQVFLGLLGRLLCVRRDDFITELDTENTNKPEQASMDDHASMVKEYTRLVAPAEWRQLSVVLDRLLVVIFLVIAIATVIALMAYPSTA